jgi:hypothetical protein
VGPPSGDKRGAISGFPEATATSAASCRARNSIQPLLIFAGTCPWMHHIITPFVRSIFMMNRLSSPVGQHESYYLISDVICDWFNFSSVYINFSLQV